MSRPRSTDRNIVEIAVRERLWPKVHTWLKSGGWDYTDEDEINNSIKELVDAVQYDRDGYKMARHLDDWEPDSELVDILDAFTMHDVHERCVAEWVVQTKPTTTFKLGDAVLVRQGMMDTWKQGIIDEINEKLAIFQVRIPSEGHEPKHVSPNRTKSVVCHGWHVPWEDVRPTSGAVPSP